ncbi:hypothetical protein ONZ43_g3787 [Nemania bipapillata]|uniref:Uncharacterized protein n=1 Tax=Nemania bipapillata TaxID=110536 RepID=A0ACC2IVY1_9PEZI|nr:hypothetical protein ONZ43_g3787 [Nemania bipapillata]
MDLPSHKASANSSVNAPKRNQYAESQVELHPVKDWSGNGFQEVYVSSDERAHAAMPSNGRNGISVMNDISVQTV